MSPASFPVLGLAALVASPALYHGLVDHTLPLDQMLTRYLVATMCVWAAVSVLVMLVGSPESQTSAEPAPPPDPHE